jgi:hypothetical protein
LAFGLLSLAILALMAVFTSGVRAASQARNITVATELGKTALEKIRSNITTVGFASIPGGTYTFDGRLGQSQTGAPPYPPSPYPSAVIAHQEYTLVVSGEETVVGEIKGVRVDVYWNDTSHVTLETKFTP